MAFNISKLLVTRESSIYEVLEVIQNGNAQIALVVDNKKKLLGTISDGDVRRSILKRGNLLTNAESIMRRNFKFITVDEDIEEALKKMKKEKIFQIPVIDKNGILLDLLLLKDFLRVEEKKNNLVIMAGGKGMRLRPYTEKCPKPMLKINGKPILEIILEQCIEYGFRQFHFSVNYLKNQIIDYFGNGKKWDVNINYLIEKKPLGTAGSLQLLPKQSQPFIVINGDLLTRLDLNRILNFHIENQADATLGVRNHTEKVPYGVVKVEGTRLLSFEEKPTFNHLVNAGVYVINPNLLDIIKVNSFLDMPNFLEIAKDKSHKISVYPIHEYWLDIGKPEFLEKAHSEWIS